MFNACPKFLPFLLLGVSADFCVLFLGVHLCRTALSTHSKLITCVLLYCYPLYSLHIPYIVAEHPVFLAIFEVSIGNGPKERKEIDTEDTDFNNLTFNRISVYVLAIRNPTPTSTTFYFEFIVQQIQKALLLYIYFIYSFNMIVKTYS